MFLFYRYIQALHLTFDCKQSAERAWDDVGVVLTAHGNMRQDLLVSAKDDLQRICPGTIAIDTGNRTYVTGHFVHLSVPETHF